MHIYGHIQTDPNKIFGHANNDAKTILTRECFKDIPSQKAH